MFKDVFILPLFIRGIFAGERVPFLLHDGGIPPLSSDHDLCSWEPAFLLIDPAPSLLLLPAVFPLGLRISLIPSVWKFDWFPDFKDWCCPLLFCKPVNKHLKDCSARQTTLLGTQPSGCYSFPSVILVHYLRVSGSFAFASLFPTAPCSGQFFQVPSSWLTFSTLFSAVLKAVAYLFLDNVQNNCI